MRVVVALAVYLESLAGAQAVLAEARRLEHHARALRVHHIIMAERARDLDVT